MLFPTVSFPASLVPFLFEGWNLRVYPFILILTRAESEYLRGLTHSLFAFALSDGIEMGAGLRRQIYRHKICLGLLIVKIQELQLDAKVLYLTYARTLPLDNNLAPRT